MRTGYKNIAQQMAHHYKAYIQRNRICMLILKLRKISTNTLKPKISER